MLHRSRWVIFAAAIGVALAGGCKKKEAGPLERAGANLDRAVEKAADKTERALDKAAEKTADALDAAADAVEEATDNSGGG